MKNYILSLYRKLPIDFRKKVKNVFVKEPEVKEILNQEEFLYALKKYDVISFDIFDTLVTRCVYNPDDVFNILSEYLKDPNFLLKRKKAEQNARNRYNYDVNLQLSRENFPDKSYGNIVLPQGNYEAFRIIIGKGKGRNWWCVMFPPLCFVDESKAEVEYDKVEKEIKDQQDNEQNNLEEDYKDCDNGDKDNIVIKFKLAEVIQNLFK